MLQSISNQPLLTARKPLNRDSGVKAPSSDGLKGDEVTLSVNGTSGPRPSASSQLSFAQRVGAALMGGLALFAAVTPAQAADLGPAVDVTRAVSQEEFLKLTADPVTDGRLTLIRTQVDPGCSRDCEKSPHQNFGVDLGNGLLLDTAGNLTLRPYAATRGKMLPEAQELKLQEGWNQTSWTRTADGDKFQQGWNPLGTLKGNKIDYGWGTSPHTARPVNGGIELTQGWGSQSYTITQKGNVTTISRGWLQPTTTITREGNQVKVDLGPWQEKFTLSYHQNGLSIDSTAWFSTSQVVSAGNVVTLKGNDHSGTTTFTEKPGKVEVVSPWISRQDLLQTR